MGTADIVSLDHYRGMITELPTPLSWGGWLDEYQHRLSLTGRSTGTIKLRDYHLRRFALDVGLPPAEILEHHILDHLDRDEWSLAYRRSVLGTLRSFFKWARRAGHVLVDVAEDVDSIAVALTLPRPASDEALEAGRNARDPRVRYMVRLADEAGLRCCEIAQVHSRDIIGTPGRYSLVAHGKGAKERAVPVSDALASIILDADGYLFPGQVDGHLSAGYVSKLISRALHGTGTAHELRHRAATEWLNTPGANLRIVQELLGHTNVNTTQIYTLVTGDQKRDIVTRRAA